MESLVHIEGLTKTFNHGGQPLEVLKGIDLVINEGEMLSIVGKSGTGKSTLLHIIGTLDAPTSGNLFFDGEDLSRMNSAQLARFRNRSIGFVFQFHHLLPEFTALENVMMPALINRIPRHEAQMRAQKILIRVGLEQRMTHRPGELAGGEQQRVALARALIMEPRLLLADEPTGNLDSQTSNDIHNLFFELNRESNTAMLVVTHDTGLAQRIPRRLQMIDGILHQGQYLDPRENQ